MLLKRTTLILISVLLLSTTAFADGSGSSAADFLNLGVSARAAATGGAFGAIADGPMSSYYNPAGLSQSENYQIAGMHSEWFQDLQYEYLGYSQPVGQKGGFGLSFIYLSMGTINGYDASNNSIGDIAAYDMATVASYGHQMNENLSVGVSGKWINEKLDEVTASGFAGDVGMQYRTYKYKLGLSIMNFGPKMSYENSSSSLPTSISAGMAYYPFGTNLSFLLGSTTPLNGRTSFKTGVEYSYQGLLMFRAGYDSEANYGEQNGFSMGGGIAVSGQNLDYAYNLNDLMGSTHQISFVFKFGKTREKTQSVEKSSVSYTEPAPVTQVASNTPAAPVAQVTPVTPVASASLDNSGIFDEDFEDSFSNNESTKEVKTPEQRYLVIAARYNVRSDADKHASTLSRLGLKAQSYKAGENDYYVVLKQAKNLKKAEKEKSKHEKNGINCEIIPL